MRSRIAHAPAPERVNRRKLATVATKPKGLSTTPLRLILMFVDDFSNLNKMNMNETKSIHDKAIRLIEGGHVEQNGLWVRAIEVPIGFDTCQECDMDSLCDASMSNLCVECESITNKYYLLKLVSKQK